MKTSSKLYNAIILMFVLLISDTLWGQKKPSTSENSAIVTAEALKLNMRRLCEDHIVWTRNVIICIVDDVPGKQQAIKRLIQNQMDIGNALKPYYGNDDGSKFTELLITQVNIAIEAVVADKDNNIKALDFVIKKGYANADAIALFLKKENPNWALTEMKELMHNHFYFTNEESTQRLKKDYDADIAAYDKLHCEILKMSDMIVDDIVKQFPAKFKMEGNKTGK